MPAPIRFEAPTPLQYFAMLVADDASFSLLEAAISVAQDEYPRLDAQAVLAEIDAMADRLRRRLPADAGPLQRLRALNQYFFQELGFGGNVNDYYDRRNSYLIDVLRTRRGIPITLALLYVELATQVGLDAAGVSFPGHFLVKLHLPRGEVIVDPFTGHSLSREQLDERLAPYRREQGLVGDFEAPLGLFLQAAAPREILARLLRNLKEIHRGARDWPRLLAVLERLVVLLPDGWEERRDRALVQAELGRLDEAVDDLQAYLEHAPSARDAAALRRRLAAWRRGRRGLLH
ncbi:MAG: tetratricopeptide repeat protein [Rubrivivax sp.]|jgi:regulator of sirC expression with transglutaminase-like and TPR domain|nr:tetratricopeptide repeat protein [Rubrivivax sp.]